MKKSISHTILIVCILGIAGFLHAQTPVTKIPNDTKPIAITNWLVAGPFPSPDVVKHDQGDAKRQGYTTDFLKSIGGETNPKIHEGTSVKSTDGSRIKFKPYLWDKDYLDLTKVFKKKNMVCAYLYTELESDVEQTIFLHLGTNDAGKLWVDGELVAFYAKDRGAKPSQNIAKIKLQPKKCSSLLLKVDNGARAWGAYMQVYGESAHQHFMIGTIPESVDISAPSQYLSVGETMHATLDLPSLVGVDLDGPVKWELKEANRLTTIDEDSNQIDFVIQEGLDGGMTLLATKQIEGKVIHGELRFIVKKKEKKIFEDKGTVLNIGNKRELFVDYYLINKLIDTRLVLKEPRDMGKVLGFEKPWEGPHSAYCTVIKDDKKYKLYYRGTPIFGEDGNYNENTCYAESEDGIHWQKPNLGIYEIMGTKDNNVIFANDESVTHNFCPFIDKNPNALPNEKFKAFGGVGESGLFGLTSKDGIHWKKIGKTPLFRKGVFDSQNVAFWSESENCYVLYFRTWTGPDFSGIRTISRTTSKDFIHWEEPVRMDFGYTPLEHLYTNQTSPYFRAPHIYIAIAARFMPGRQVISEEEAKIINVNPDLFRDCSDAIMMTSRGGNKYDRTFMESFIKPGIGLQNWVSRSNYPELNVIQTGPEEMSLYVSHDNAQPTKHLRRYTLRLDGFASLNAPYSGGEMITKLLTFSGKELVLNFATSAAGFIKVEILDQEGNKIPGFELENSKEIIGNEIEKTVTWKSNPNLEKLNNKPVRLRFVMKDADLYSLKFE